MTRRRRSIQSVLAICVIGAGVWGLVWWARYPKVPDAANIEMKQALEFLATDDFLRLTAGDRKKYMKVIADRHRELPIQELVRRMLDPDMREFNRRISENLRKVPEEEQIVAPFLEVFLDKLYALTPVERQQYLLTIALAQQARLAQGGDSRMANLRDPAKFQEEMTRFMSRTSPQLQAKMGQFMMDLKRTRGMFGMKDPV